MLIAASATPAEKGHSEHGPDEEVTRAHERVSRPRRVSPVRPTASPVAPRHWDQDGSIIATIITTHMPRNDAAAPGHACPGIRIHAIDIVQPPGIGI
jgi:hypothetical protein